MKITRHTLRLEASPKAVIAQFLHLPGTERLHHIIKRVEEMTYQEAAYSLNNTLESFGTRHRNIIDILSEHFKKIAGQSERNLDDLSREKKLVLGAFLTKEYSFQAAALFNPSVVAHPDQDNLKSGEQRFLMSLRATGEGHISSIAFQTGILNRTAAIRLDDHSGFFTTLNKKEGMLYSKNLIRCNLDLREDILKLFPETFTAENAQSILSSLDENDRNTLNRFFDSNYDLESNPNTPLNEKIIFPRSRTEKTGMEDVRLVRFTDGDEVSYYGTYTAYDGYHITSQLLETKDFNTFKIRSLQGTAISDKGMALFPEKVNGQYVIISRQGGENVNIMFSENLYQWDNYRLLLEPQFPWELVQVGNCGSPVKTEKGWLLLTHGVGTMRTYVISAILLDLHDPSRIVGRLQKPLIEADAEERDGYVPNVVYTCGMLRHHEFLFIPYAASDSTTAFATVDLNELLNEMKK